MTIITIKLLNSYFYNIRLKDPLWT